LSSAAFVNSTVDLKQLYDAKTLDKAILPFGTKYIKKGK
jgi:hypothetical protein